MKTLLLAVLFAVLAGCNLGAIDPTTSNADPVDPSVCSPVCNSGQVCDDGACLQITFTPDPSIHFNAVAGGPDVTLKVKVGIVGTPKGPLVVTAKLPTSPSYSVQTTPVSFTESGELFVTVKPGSAEEASVTFLVYVGSEATVSISGKIDPAANDYAVSIEPDDSGSFSMSQTATDNTHTLKVTKTSGNPGDVTFQSVASDCTGLSATLGQGTIAMDGSTSIAITTANAQTGTCHLTFVGKDTTNITKSLKYTLIVNGPVVQNDWSLEIVPSGDFTIGQNAVITSYSLKATKVSGSPGRVTFEQTVSSSTGLYGTIGQTGVDMEGVASVNILTVNAQTGSAKLTFAGTDSSGVRHSVELHGIVTAPVAVNDYSLAVIPGDSGSFSMNQNASDATHALKATRVSGTPGQVTVQQVVSTCTGVSGSVAGGVVAMDGSSAITITTSSTAQTGSCKLSFVGSNSTGETRSVDFNLTVNGPVVQNNYALTVTPSDSGMFVMNATASDATHALKATRVSGTPGQVTVQQVVSTCTGVSGSVASNSVAMDGTSLITIVTASAQTGTCKLSFVGKDTTGVTQSVEFSFSVVSGGFSFTVTPGTYSAVQGVAGVLSVLVTGSVSSGNAELVNYTITTDTGCVGFTTSVTTASIMSDLSFTFDADWAASAPVEVCTITVKGVSPSMPNGYTKTVVITLSGGGGNCTSDTNCQSGQFCNLITKTCQTVGKAPGATCTTDANCAPGVCLSTGVCSHWQFSETCTVDVARYEFYSPSGFTRAPPAAAGTTMVSDVRNDEQTGLAVATDYTKCTCTWFTGKTYTTGVSSGSYTSGAAQCSWNGPPTR